MAEQTKNKPKFYFKILGPKRKPCHGGRGIWPPVGKWTTKKKPRLCVSGYHMCRGRDVLNWLTRADVPQPDVYIAEVADNATVGKSTDKIVVSQARLVRKISLSAENKWSWFVDCIDYILRMMGCSSKATNSIVSALRKNATRVCRLGFPRDERATKLCKIISRSMEVFGRLPNKRFQSRLRALAAILQSVVYQINSSYITLGLPWISARDTNNWIIGHLLTDYMGIAVR